MVYKFNTSGIDKNNDTYMELSRDEDFLMVISGDYDNEHSGNFHYLHQDEIDDMIIALTNIKNDITQWKKENA